MRCNLVIIALILTACGMEDSAGKKKYQIEDNSGSLTRNSDNTLSVSATLLGGDEAQADVDVVFLIDCDGDTRLSLEATTNAAGVATASTTEAVPEQNCSVTLIVDGDDTAPMDIAAETKEDDSDDDKTPQQPPVKLMGKIHPITWTQGMNLSKCNPSTGVLALKANNPNKLTIIRTNPQDNTDIHLLVLAIKGAKSIDGKDPSCRVGTTDIVFDSKAYDDNTTLAQFHALSCKPAGTCFNIRDRGGNTWTIGSNSDAKSAIAGSMWIRRTANTDSNGEIIHRYVLYSIGS